MRIIISNFFDVYLHKYLIRKNYKLVFFAYLAQFCNAFLALIFLPLYFSNLKVEEYGLIGFYTLIQSIFSIVEVSIFPVVIDRIQKLNINNIKKNLINYIKNIKILIIIFGVTIIILNILIYNLLNYEWLNYRDLNKSTVRDSIFIISIIILFRLLEGIFRAILYGLHSHSWYDIISILFSIIRYTFAYILIIQFNSIVFFFMWQLIVAILLAVLLNLKINLLVNNKNDTFKTTCTKNLFNYFIDLFNGSIKNLYFVFISILYINIDKIIVSYKFSLNDFANYMLTTSAASILFLFAVPITQSMMSTFFKYNKVNDRHLLFIKYITCTNFISFILIPFAVNAYFYSEGIIYFWTGNIFLVHSISSLFAIIVVAYSFNSLSYLPSQLLITQNLININLKINISILLLYLLIISNNNINNSSSLSSILLFTSAIHFFINKIYVEYKFFKIVNIIKLNMYPILILFVNIGVAVLYKNLIPEYYINRIEWFIFIILTTLTCIILNVLLYIILNVKNKITY